MEAYYNKPYVFIFLAKIFYKDKINVLDNEGLSYKINNLKKATSEKIYKNIDTSLFRKDFSEEKIFKYIRLLMDGYEAELIRNFEYNDINFKNIESICKEFYDYLDDLKIIFYN